jgi:phosphotransacetylase
LASGVGEADALICGLEGRYARHLRDISQIIGKRDGVADYSALSLLISQRGATFFTDTYVSMNPSAEEIAETTVMAAHEIRRFGITPKAALVSHFQFRFARFRKRQQDAQGDADHPLDRAGSGSGWRNAWRFRHFRNPAQA